MSLAFDVNATAICPHGGQITVVPGGAPRVLLGGQPAATLGDQYVVTGCPFQVPVPGGTKPQPCVTVQWVVPALRVSVGRQPAILSTSSGICFSAEQIPQGPPNVIATQIRVSGS
jgi:uncharacterized Zn-binding protein involved in type VI secretion